VPLHVHQPLAGEHRDGRAHREPATAEPLTQVHLHQALTGNELTGQDGGPQLV